MGRTKKIDYMRTIFMVEIQPSHYFGGVESTTENLENRTNLSGIDFTQEKISEGVYQITSRTRFPKFAIQDHFFLIRNFEKQYGRVYDIKFLARGSAVKYTEYNIPYAIVEDKLQPVNEWENFQAFELTPTGYIVE